MSSSSSTLVHIITGKGGVGKSTFAASLVRALAEKGEGPILLIEVQGSGRSLELLGLEDHFRYEAQSVRDLNNVWASRILPKPAFRQYFSLLLSLGQQDSAFAQITSGLRDRLVDTVLSNKVVSAFVDVCPGLEPAALLGKIHWEATEGEAPETGRPWRHVVMDAPSTGHALMLFRSTQALVEVFGSGIVFKQASEIMSLMRDPSRTRLYVLSTPEELPLKEAADLSRGLEALGLPKSRFVLNRVRPPVVASSEAPSPVTLDAWNTAWAREARLEKERSDEEDALLEDFLKKQNLQDFVVRIPEVFSSHENLAPIVKLLVKELK
ncbi:MAG: ArsA-related P-loop ATPase [Bdellovibrionota bacterium]